jgi:fermentation-respiration switch protein FrsA (DUF1100 family)
VAAPGFHQGMDMSDRLTGDAHLISASVLFHVQLDDEQFPREGQLALFDALGTPDKQLIAYSGSHGETHPSAPTYWRDFMTRSLHTA